MWHCPDLSRPHPRRLQRRIIIENDICNLTRLIAFEVEPLRREVDRFEGVRSFGGRQTFLAASDRTAQCNIKRGVDPNLQVELIAIRRFEEENALQQENVDIPEDVVVLSVSHRLGITTIGDNINTALISQRKDQPVEHFFEPQRVVIEMFRRVVAVDANIRQVQPIVRTDYSDAPAEIAQPLIELRGDEAFTAPVDSGNANEQCAMKWRFQSRRNNLLRQLIDRFRDHGCSRRR